MFRNLEAELKRQGITREKLAECLGVNISTISAKLTKPDRIKLCEAMKIQRMFFPGMDLSYLFEQAS